MKQKSSLLRARSFRPGALRKSAEGWVDKRARIVFVFFFFPSSLSAEASPWTARSARSLPLLHPPPFVRLPTLLSLSSTALTPRRTRNCPPVHYNQHWRERPALPRRLEFKRGQIGRETLDAHFPANCLLALDWPFSESSFF